MKQKIFFISIFMILACIPLFGVLTGLTSVDYAADDLSPKPYLIENGQINTSYTSEFEDYWQDRFPFRSKLISAYHFVIAKVFQTSANPKVMIGQDGWLFFSETYDDAIKHQTLTSLELKKIEHTLALMSTYLRNQNKEFLFTLIPNKATIYFDKLPLNVSFVDKAGNLDLWYSTKRDIPQIDIREDLLREKETRAVYQKTDTHWNAYGSEVFVRRVLEYFGLPYEPVSFQNVAFHGDLMRMLYPANLFKEGLTDYAIERNYSYLRPVKSVEDLLIMTKREAGEGTYIFRDSFFNLPVPRFSSLLSAVTFDKVFPYDLRNIAKTDRYVLMEIAERNLNWYLQATPVMPAPAISAPENFSQGKHSAQVVLESKKGLLFVNGKWKQVNSIERVILDTTAGSFELFPVYEDGNIEDDLVLSGFSGYLPEGAQWKALYYFENDTWYLSK